MPTQTFNPGTTVPPTGVIGSSAHITDDSLGTDITPAGWPSTGKATAVEVEVTATSIFTRDGQVQVGVSTPGDLEPISGLSDAGGTFSGHPGQVGGYRTGATEAYHLDKFGGWRTEYATFSATGATENRMEMSSTETPTGGFDIRAKVRCADWTANINRVICTTFTGLGKYRNRLFVSTSQIHFRTTSGDELYMGPTFSVPQTSFTHLANGEWLWVRVTFAAGGDATMWESADGVTWSPVATLTAPDWSDTLSTGLYVGATNQNNSGFDGDIAEFVAYDAGGALIHDLNLSSMTSNVDRDWSSAVSNIHDNMTVSARAYGATIPATVRVRLDLESPVAMDDWRLIIDAQVGEVTVDEILLEWADAASGGRQIGPGRGVRGLGQ